VQAATPPPPQSLLGTSGTMAPSASMAPRIPGEGRGRILLALAAIAGAAAIACVVFFRMRSRPPPQLAVDTPSATGLPPAPVPTTPEELAPVSTSEAVPLPTTKVPASALHASAPAHASISLDAGSPTPAPTTTHATAALEAGSPPKEAAPCLSEEEVQKVMRPHLTRLNRMCFARNETDRSSVNVNATLTIGVDGVPQTVTASGDDTAVSQCVETHLRGWRFPAAGCTEKISIPFRFPLR
jgi:hypothetical protein